MGTCSDKRTLQSSVLSMGAEHLPLEAEASKLGLDRG